VADAHGAFRFLNVPIDSCSIEADVQGFLAPPVTLVIAAPQVVTIELHLGVAPMRVGVNVGGTTPPRESQLRPGSSRSDAGRPRASKRYNRDAREQ
jgi:hypothetical protein